MSNDSTIQSRGQSVLRQYEGYAWMGGAALGAVAGVLISGPHFFEWPALNSAAVILGGGFLGALIGWLFVSVVIGSVGAGAGPSGALGEAGPASGGGGGGDIGGGDGGGD